MTFPKRTTNVKVTEVTIVHYTLYGDNDDLYEIPCPLPLLNVTPHGYECCYENDIKLMSLRPPRLTKLVERVYLEMWMWSAWGNYDPYFGMGTPHSLEVQETKKRDLFWVLDKVYLKGDYTWWKAVFDRRKRLSHSYGFDYTSCEACVKVGVKSWIFPESDMCHTMHMSLVEFFEKCFKEFCIRRDLTYELPK